MREPPKHERYIDSPENGLAGFSVISLWFWRTAEKLRDEADKQTAGQTWRTHWSIHSAMCLYHAALECFINEEIALFTSRLEPSPDKSKFLTDSYRVQGSTLSGQKVDDFFSLFGLAAQLSPDVRRRASLLIGLRNRLSHHWPLLGDVRDYPVQVIAALDDAKIERINTSWTGQCSDIRLAEWAAKVVRGFVDEWWRLGRAPAGIERLHWEYGPDWRYPSDEAQAPQ